MTYPPGSSAGFDYGSCGQQASIRLVQYFKSSPIERLIL